MTDLDRRAAWERFAERDSTLRTFGCFGRPPPQDHAFKRYWVAVSFEDASDVSDYSVEHDRLDAAVQEYRALRVFDLDEGVAYDVDRVQRLGERVAGL